MPSKTYWGSIPFILGIKSKPATKEDSAVAADLLDTLKAHHETFIGKATVTVSQQ